MKKSDKILIEEQAREMLTQGNSMGQVSKHFGINLDYLRAILNFEKSRKEIDNWRIK